MIFLIVYDRVESELRSIESFSDDERDVAYSKKMDTEISLIGSGSGAVEVILLEASSEEQLHATHRRYFNTLKELKVVSPSGGKKRD